MLLVFTLSRAVFEAESRKVKRLDDRELDKDLTTPRKIPRQESAVVNSKTKLSNLVKRKETVPAAAVPSNSLGLLADYGNDSDSN